MKKFLLACAAVALGTGFASAETLTLDFVNNTYEMTRLSGNTSEYAPAGVIVNENDVVVNNLSENAPSGGVRLWSDGLRFYKNGVIEVVVAGGDITSITATGTLANITIGGESASNGWTGSAESVQIKYTATSKNAPLKTLTIEYTVGASDLEPAGLSFPETEYTVKYPNGTFTAPELSKDTDATVTYSSSDEDVATVAENGEVTILKPGTTIITARCEATDKYAAGSAKYTLTVFASASSLKDLTDLAAIDAKGTFEIDCPLTVTYVNGANVYVIDAANDATLIYMSYAQAANYKAGDVLSTGWMVTYSPYNGLPEYKPADSNLPEVTAEDATFDIPEITLAEVSDAYLNKLFIIKNLKLTEEIPAEKTNVTITNGDVSLDFRNNFGLDAFTPDTDKEYSVKGILSIYNNNLQFYPIEYNVASGVASVEANEGVAKYFDLNGRQVKGQLSNGIYVKVLDGKASKVLVK